jgi:hypothetical protein
MSDHKLNKVQKVYVITQLATFETLTAVREGLKQEFGVDISLPALMHYQPPHAKLKKAFKDLFDETRKQFLEDTAAIPIANKAFRLKQLDRLLQRQIKLSDVKQNTVEMRATLEQAAKESGNQFTNRTEHTAADGKALIPAGTNVVLYLPDNGRGDAAELGPPADNADKGVKISSKKPK